MEKMTSEDLAAALRPKIDGSWNLHTLLPKDMDFFVLLSSSAGIIGSRGQGNYSAGNTYQDALAHYRASKNLPAATIDLGIILSVGYVAETSLTANDTHQMSVVENLKNLGLVGIREEEFLAILAGAITSFGRPGTNIPCQVITGISTGGMVRQAGLTEEPNWFADARFSHIRIMDTQASRKGPSSSGPPLQRLLSEAGSISAAATIICEAIATRLAKSLRVPLEDLDPSKPVNAYGVDSLMAVELRNFIFREIKADMSIFDIISSNPLTTLSSKIAASSSLVQVAVEPEQD
jgi:acyl carrier protein